VSSVSDALYAPRMRSWTKKAASTSTSADQWRGEGWDDPRTREGTAAAGDSLFKFDTGSATTSTYDVDRASLGTSWEDTFAPATSTDDMIKVGEENCPVAKRDVKRGSVKVRSYTTEMPVSEDDSWRDENVAIERRPVDRPGRPHPVRLEITWEPRAVER
jgi:hypothetical protein